MATSFLLKVRFLNPITIILLAQLIYSAFFLIASSSVVNNVRYFLLFDDAMISMKYAKTLVETGELVWFPGADRVQGYTNFLWTIFMALVHLLPIPSSKISIVIQLTGILLIPLTGLFSIKIYNLLFDDHDFSWIPFLLIVFYLPFYIWSGLGMETGFCAFLLSICTYYSIKGVLNKKIYYRLFIYMILGFLTRIDYMIFVLVFLIFTTYNVTNSKYKITYFAYCILCTVFIFAGFILFQHFYYDDYFPNTAYLKLGVPLMTRVNRGLDITNLFFSNISYLFILVSFFILIRSNKVATSIKVHIILLISIALLYNIFVGGDAWEWGANANRFLVPIFPLIALVFSFAIETLINRFNVRGIYKYIITLGLAIFVVFRINVGNIFDYQKAFSKFKQFVLTDEVITRPNHDIAMLKAGLLLKDSVKNPLRIAVSSAGIAPYLIDKSYFIDVLGRSDKFISKQKPKNVAFLPGHVKWDVSYSVNELKADIIIGNWANIQNSFREPLLKVPGKVPIFVKKSILSTRFVSGSELLSIYRKYAYGSELEFLVSLLSMEGFYNVEESERLWMSKKGSITLPGNSELCLAYEAIGAMDISFTVDDNLIEQRYLEPGVTYRFSIGTLKKEKVVISCSKSYRPCDLHINNDYRELTILLNEINLESF